MVAGYQVLLGLLLGWWATVFLGCWNAFAAYTRFRQSKLVKKPCQGMVEAYRKRLGSSICFIVLNAAVGGFIGIAGAIYDLVVRHYVLAHAAVLGQAEEKFAPAC